MHSSNSSSIVEEGLYLRRLIRNQDGSIAFDSGEQKVHSFTLQYLKFLWHCTNHAQAAYPVDEGTVVDTSNGGRTLEGTMSNAAFLVAMIGAAGTSTYGVVVGSGNAAESISSYTLQTQIAHGVGAGQLQYGATSSNEPVIAGANCDWVIQRVFTNGSGGDVSVNEVGIYVTCQDAAATQRYYCIVRDVLGSTDTVQNGQTDTVTYTIRVAA